MSAEARAEMVGVLSKQFFAWDAMREQRDEALTRCDELEAQRDQAREWAVQLEQELAAVRRLACERRDLAADAEYGDLDAATRSYTFWSRFVTDDAEYGDLDAATRSYTFWSRFVTELDRLTAEAVES